VALVEGDGGVADVAGFQDEAGNLAGAGFGFEAGEEGGGDALATGGGADVHAFYFGEVVFGGEGEGAAADWGLGSGGR